MHAAKEYTDEQLNYYKICHVTTDILTEGLRTIFKQEWDSRYRTTFGEWKDDASNGKDFYNAESPETERGTRICCPPWLKEIERNGILRCYFTPFSTQIASTV